MCAVLHDGTARCWGRNNELQLGDGGDAWPFSPTPVEVAELDDVVAIAPNGRSTCALREGGEVYCWGWNVWGQLGDGTLFDHFVPAPVSGLLDAVAISGAADHYCAVRANGRVVCWGAGSHGELGSGLTGAGADKTTPSTVRTSILATLEGAVAVATGNATSCAVRANGTAYCWGGDVHGLGNGTAGTWQAYAQSVSGITAALEVSMGSSSQCVHLATGVVRCFGTNTYGELGSWLAPLGTDQLTPVGVGGVFSPLQTVLSIDSGFDHSCAMLATGEVKCWGLNGNGQLGDGTLTNRATPVTVAGFP
jgi:alpha-tubulin suppressor-like RCC1 family protein